MKGNDSKRLLELAEQEISNFDSQAATKPTNQVTWTTQLRVLADEIFQDPSNYSTCYRNFRISSTTFIILTVNYLISNACKVETLPEDETKSITTESNTVRDENEPTENVCKVESLGDDDNKSITSESDTAHDGIEPGIII